jgi:rod shape determining protein RodA
MNGQGIDRGLLAAVAGLLVTGVLALYSAGQTDVPTLAAQLWERQLVFVGIGAIVAAAAFRFSSPRFLEWSTPFLYATAIVLLLLTLAVGTGAGTAAGARSWLAIGSLRIGQPTELAKIATILLLARHLATKREPPNTLWGLMPACLIAAAPFALVGLQPDLGSAIVFLGVLFSMLFWAGVNPWLLFLLASPLLSLMLAFSTVSWGIWIVIITALLIWIRPYALEGIGTWLVNVGMGVMALSLWNRLAPYQQNRLLSFLNPEIDPRATGWHIIQSKVAIGSGGLMGKGFTEGTQKRLAFIPEQGTDFIYSVVGEEFGFVGVMVTLVLFAALITAFIRIARRATDPFACLVVFGLGSMLFVHVLESIGMTIGLMPITGIPLPFFSYGGSFLLVCAIAVGIALRVSWSSRLAGYAE